MENLVTLDEITAARERIKSAARYTPLIDVPYPGATESRLLLKCENLQRMGAFKFRGAFNALSKLGREQKAKGVLAYSSGNHAQAVALAAQMLGMPAVIVMPDDAPAVKLAATRGYGAQIVTYDRMTEQREAIAQARDEVAV